MADFAVFFARSAEKELGRFAEPLCSRILTRIEALARDPRPHGCRKLEGGAGLWRVRIGDYRVLYSIDDRRRTVDVIAIRHRADAYR